MNLRVIVISEVVIVSMIASGRVMRQLSAPEFLDTEVSACHRLRQPEYVKTLDFSLAFNGTSTNNVEIAFGCDADGDNVLAVHETEMIVGWRCGRYFIENFQTGEIVEEANVGTNGVKRFVDWHYRVRGNKTVICSFAATNEVGAAFLGLTAAKPHWIYNGNWNLMRLTARGVDAQDERFEVNVLPNGLAIRLR